MREQDRHRLETYRSLLGPSTMRMLNILERLEAVSDDVRKEEDGEMSLPYSSAPTIKAPDRWVR